MRKTLVFTTLLLFTATLSTGAAWAQEDPPPDPGTGIVYVKLSADYAVPYKDGERYEEHEFYKGGKQLNIEGCMRDQEYVFELRPMEEMK